MVESSSHFSYDHLLRNPNLIKENSGSLEYDTLERFQGDNLLAFSAKSYRRALAVQKSFRGHSYFLLGVF